MKWKDTSIKLKMVLSFLVIALSSLLFLAVVVFSSLNSLRLGSQAANETVSKIKETYIQGILTKEDFLSSQFFNLVANEDMGEIQKMARRQLTKGDLVGLAFYLADATPFFAEKREFLAGSVLGDKPAVITSYLNENQPQTADVAFLNALAANESEEPTLVKERSAENRLRVTRRFGQVGTASGYMVAEFDLSPFLTLQTNLVTRNNEITRESQKNLTQTALMGLVSLGLFSFLAILLLSRSLLTPLLSLQKAAEEISLGSYEKRVEILGKDEISSLAGSFNAMLGAIAERDVQLRNYASGLEQLVEEKTKAIRSILDNVEFGLFTCGSDGVIREGFSQSCIPLLNAGNLPLCGQELISLLTQNAQAISHFRACYEQIFEVPMACDVFAKQLPSLFSAHGKVLSLIASPIVEDGDVASVLFCIKDVTEFVKAEKEINESKALIKILSRKTQFYKFAEVFESSLSEAVRQVQSDTRFVRRVLHTLKGDFGVFGLTPMVDVIHATEGLEVIDASHLAQIEEQFRSFLKNHQEVIGYHYGTSSEEVYTVAENQFQMLASSILNSDQIDQMKESVLQFVQAAKSRPAADVFKPLVDLTQQLTKKIGKKANFQLQGAEVRLPQNLLPLFQNLPHWLRNALDHGVELSTERFGKPEIANVELRVVDTGTAWQLHLSDDGRGLDADLFVEVGVRKGFITREQVEGWSEEQKWELMYIDGLSTKAEASDISGRGVGMSALRAAVLQLGGTLSVQSVRGKGTTFVAVIPHE